MSRFAEIAARAPGSSVATTRVILLEWANRDVVAALAQLPLG